MLTKKRGISPLIATVLLIGFVIALLLLAILWGKGYIEELAQKRGLLAEKQQQCQNIEITAIKAERRGGDIEVVLKNKKETTVNKFIFRVVGKENGEAFESSQHLNSLEVKSYTVTFAETDIKEVTSLDVIPHLQVAPGHYVPCSKQSIKVKVS